jgi:hypothetical protein
MDKPSKPVRFAIQSVITVLSLRAQSGESLIDVVVTRKMMLPISRLHQRMFHNHTDALDTFDLFAACVRLTALPIGLLTAWIRRSALVW